MRTVLLGCYPEITKPTNSISGFERVVKTVDTMKDVNGEDFNSIYTDDSNRAYHVTLTSLYPSTNNASRTHFLVGDSNMPSNENDYSLSGNYVLGTDYIVNTSVDSNATMVNGKAQVVFNVVVTAINTINIAELGLMKRLPYSNLSGSEQPTYLFGRVAFPASISLLPNEKATFQVTIEI